MIGKSQLIDASGKIPFLGSALRWYANQYKDDSVVKIKSGYGKGLCWKRRHGWVNGYWTGQYELILQKTIANHLKPGNVFWDIGATAGVFTVLAARFVGPNGFCLAVDPSPENARLAKDQLALNSVTTAAVLEMAIGREPGRMHFSFDHAGSAMGHIGSAKVGERQIEVDIETLDGLAKRFPMPDLIKMDIENAELDALEGAQKLLSMKRTIWLIEIHSPQARLGLLSQFGDLGMTVHFPDSNHCLESGE